ncbi:uncharacterized protein LOC18446767 isoform X3 [Amborella trichopoda]|uniref:uncharacterized protein LOC18446767 isoform X3 n=1 Tax=Amborella trichopoda TaxID=13333 RepID=UPI0009C08AF0|nr:uncharacterized protein LOC18446767 isoform X3 [Amborella trichopoda]|eukprot:XP_020530789.1 uncharacterized protein LOC18446767 isoform X3 [Amborella trichopoda]
MKAKLAKEVGATFRDSGFFHSINHCIPKEPTETVTENLKLFFHQPLEEKMKVQLDLTHPVSYNSNDFTNNVRDWVEIYNYLLKDKIEVPVTHELEATRIMQLHNHGPACPPGFHLVQTIVTGDRPTRVALSLRNPVPARRGRDLNRNRSNFFRISLLFI